MKAEISRELENLNNAIIPIHKLCKVNRNVQFELFNLNCQSEPNEIGSMNISVSNYNATTY